MEVAFTLYNGFLIVEYSDTDVRAYRNRGYYAGNITSYKTSSQAFITQMIDDAGDQGDFTELEYYELLRVLGRAGPPIDEGLEKAAAYIAGLIVGREDVDDPGHPVWQHLDEEYKESYRRRARRVLELANRS